jgi:tetratricopeptide (TPR) repeat protein
MKSESADSKQVFFTRFVILQIGVAFLALIITLAAIYQIGALVKSKAQLRADVSKLQEEIKTYEREYRAIAEKLAQSRSAAEPIRAGINHYQRGEYEKAVEDYTAALSIDPSNPVVYDWMGYALYRNRQYDKALSALERSVQLDPKYARGYYNMALVLWKLGRHEDAIKAVRHAVELDPEIRRQLRADDQFTPFRQLPEFRSLITEK